MTINDLNTRTIKGEKATQFCYLYGKSTYTQLSDVYKNYSREKACAFDRIQNFCNENGYYGLKILTHNPFVYTVGYMVNSRTLIVETARTIYRVEIDTMEQLHCVRGEV